jgi:hypothetical protein
MRFIASGVPYRNYQYRVQRPRALMGLGAVMSVADAQSAATAAQKAFDDAIRVNPAAFMGFEKFLDWHDLPPGMPSGLGVDDLIGSMLYLLSLDPELARNVLKDEAASPGQRFAAWVALRILYRPNNGVSWSNLNGAVNFPKGLSSFKEGVTRWSVDSEPEDMLAKKAITLDDSGLPNWGLALGVTVRRAYIWATKYAIPARAAAISQTTTALKYADADLALAEQAAKGATSGGSTEADVLELRRKQEEAEKKAAEEASRAKMYMTLGVVGVVAVGGFFWWKSRNR